MTRPGKPVDLGSLAAVLAAADTPDSMEHTPGNACSVSLSGENDAELRDYRQRLSSGIVTVPLEPAPWGDSLGMCVDTFGVSWIVNIAGAES